GGGGWAVADKGEGKGKGSFNGRVLGGGEQVPFRVALPPDQRHPDLGRRLPLRGRDHAQEGDKWRAVIASRGRAAPGAEEHGGEKQASPRQFQDRLAPSGQDREGAAKWKTKKHNPPMPQGRWRGAARTSRRQPRPPG